MVDRLASLALRAQCQFACRFRMAWTLSERLGFYCRYCNSTTGVVGTNQLMCVSVVLL